MKTTLATIAALLIAAAIATAQLGPPLIHDVEAGLQQLQELPDIGVAQGAAVEYRVRLKSRGQWLPLNGLTATWDARSNATAQVAYTTNSVATVTNVTPHYFRIPLTSAQTGTAVTDWIYALSVSDGSQTYVLGTGRYDAQEGGWTGSPGVLVGATVDWTQVAKYIGTATHGPVRADGSTITAAVNADGSITLTAIAAAPDITIGDGLEGLGTELSPYQVTEAVRDGAAAGATAQQPNAVSGTDTVGTVVSNGQVTAVGALTPWTGEGYLDSVAWGDIVGTLSDQTDLTNTVAQAAGALPKSGGTMTGALTNTAHIRAGDGADPGFGAIRGSAVGDFGVYGFAAQDYGVAGYAQNYGVYGFAFQDFGVFGAASQDYGVYGNAQNYGVYGFAVQDYGVYGLAGEHYGGWFSGGSTGLYATARDSGPAIHADNGGILVTDGQPITFGGVTRTNWPTGGGGETDHTALSNLNWTASNHSGGTNRVAGFGAAGEAVEIEYGTMIAEDSTNYYTIAETDAAIDAAVTNSVAVPTAANVSGAWTIDARNGTPQQAHITGNVTNVTFASNGAGFLSYVDLVVTGGNTNSIAWPTAGFQWAREPAGGGTNAYWHAVFSWSGTNVVGGLIREGSAP